MIQREQPDLVSVCLPTYLHAPYAVAALRPGADPKTVQHNLGHSSAAMTLDDLPGARWYLETDEYGGLEYWLPTEYVVKRGVRLILPKAE